MTWNESYSILTDPKLEKYIKKNLPQSLKSVLNRKLKYLAGNPSHPSLNTKQYNCSSKVLNSLGVDQIYEFYINMSFRCVLYVVHDKKCVIIAFVGDHKQVSTKYG